MRQKHTHCASAANKTRHLCFSNNDFYRITSLPFHFSLSSLQNQRKISLRFENMAWWQGKICEFWFKHLSWRSKLMLSAFFMASQTSHPVQLRAVGLLWGVALWGAGMVQSVSAHVWALNTHLKLHHGETTDLPRVHWSLLTALWEIKNTESQMSPFSIENCLKCYEFYFVSYFLHLRLIFSLFSATLEHIDKHSI